MRAWNFILDSEGISHTEVLDNELLRKNPLDLQQKKQHVIGETCNDELHKYAPT
jgi:hypothetical protein